MKSWKEPTPEDIRHAVASTVDSEQRRYFFNNLKNPLWIKPLWEKGFFQKPPEPVAVGDGSFQIPFWPESQYLVRVAKEAAGDVVDVVSKLQTENPRVLDDMIDIALTIDSAELSQKFSKHALIIAKSPFTRWYDKKLGKLMLHWTKLGIMDEALTLAKIIVSFRPDPQKERKAQDRNADPDNIYTRLNTTPQPGPRLDPYEYQRFLDEDISLLAAQFPWEIARILTSALSDAISWSLSEPREQESFDGSDFWCRDIKYPREHGDNPRGHLAHAVTRTCEVVLKQQPTRFVDLDNLLRLHKWYFFTRLRWYLYAQFPQLAKMQIREEALNYDSYEDGEYGNEFASMLIAAVQHNLLTDQELSQIFAKITKGPDLGSLEQSLDGKLTAEQIEVRRGYFFTKQMFPFRDVLPRFARHWDKYQILVKEHGERKLIDYFKVGDVTIITSEVKSPVTAEELLAKSDEDILHFLVEWKSHQRRYDFNSPNTFGLSKVFTEALKQQPQRFLNISNRLKVSPIYVRDFLYFANEIVKQKQAVPWDKIIQLSEWIIVQSNLPSESSEEETALEASRRDFTECRHILGGLFKNGLFDFAHSIPWEFRARVFSILKDLCSGFDSRLDSGSAFGKDFLTQAVNSVRGEALHALVNHAFWIKRHLHVNADVMQNMQEVQQVLEERLDPLRETSLAVHALFGFLTPSLIYLDSEWFRSISNRVYPSGEKDFHRWAAAWMTYIGWNRANQTVFKFTEDQYWRAIVELVAIRKEETSDSRAIEGLGEHLIILYGWGVIPLSGQKSLLEVFLANSEAKERAHLMNYAGRALENTQTVPEEITNRLRAYWECRLETVRREKKPKESSEELSDFAWWFRSGQFELSWSLKQLCELLEFVSEVPETMFLLEDLAKVAVERPIETVICLELIVNKLSTDRYVFVDEKTVKQILRIALNSQLPEAIRRAHIIQDCLMRLGRFEYRDLSEKV